MKDFSLTKDTMDNINKNVTEWVNTCNIENKDEYIDHSKNYSKPTRI